MTAEVKNYNKAELKRDREWTDAAIKKFLGEPDSYAENPRSWHAMICLYDADRVHAVEGTDEFAAWLKKSRARRASARKAATTKREKTLAVVKSRLSKVRLHKHAHGLEPETLRERAVEHYNDYQDERATWYDHYFDPVDLTGASDGFYERIEVNYLRHEGTRYDSELTRYIGKTGVADAVDVVREHVYGLIAEEYPHLAGECARQLADRRTREEQRRQWAGK